MRATACLRSLHLERAAATGIVSAHDQKNRNDGPAAAHPVGLRVVIVDGVGLEPVAVGFGHGAPKRWNRLPGALHDSPVRMKR